MPVALLVVFCCLIGVFQGLLALAVLGVAIVASPAILLGWVAKECFSKLAAHFMDRRPKIAMQRMG